MKLEDELYLVESFYSFQGEGKYVGTPSVFVRFGGCNLNCKGFGVEIVKDGVTLVGCDSLRATNKTHFKDSWTKVTDENFLIDEINSHMIELDFKPDIVITGGEPLLWHKNLLFVQMIKHYLSLGFNLTIETNATIEIDFIKYPFYKNITFAMSVKLKNSGEELEKRVNKRAIKAISYNAKKSFFKFVMDKNHLSTDEIYKITKDSDLSIYCMPLGSTADELNLHDRAVAQFCINHGFRYVDRMHIRLWNNEEGR